MLEWCMSVIRDKIKSDKKKQTKKNHSCKMFSCRFEWKMTRQWMLKGKPWDSKVTMKQATSQGSSNIINAHFHCSMLNLYPNTEVWCLDDKSDIKESVDFVSLCRVTHYIIRQQLPQVHTETHAHIGTETEGRFWINSPAELQYIK